MAPGVQVDGSMRLNAGWLVSCWLGMAGPRRDRMLCQALGDAKCHTQQSPVSPCRRWTARRGRWLPTTGGRVLSPASWAAPWTGVAMLPSFACCDVITCLLLRGAREPSSRLLACNRNWPQHAPKQCMLAQLPALHFFQVLLPAAGAEPAGSAEGRCPGGTAPLRPAPGCRCSAGSRGRQGGGAGGGGGGRGCPCRRAGRLVS